MAAGSVNGSDAGAGTRAVTDNLGGALTVDDPGTDTVTIVIKSGSTAKYEVTLDAEAVGIAMMPQIVCGTTEAVYVNLSDAVNVNYTLSYKTRTA